VVSGSLGAGDGATGGGTLAGAAAAACNGDAVDVGGSIGRSGGGGGGDAVPLPNIQPDGIVAGELGGRVDSARDDCASGEDGAGTLAPPPPTLPIVPPPPLPPCRECRLTGNTSVPPASAVKGDDDDGPVDRRSLASSAASGIMPAGVCDRGGGLAWRSGVAARLCAPAGNGTTTAALGGATARVTARNPSGSSGGSGGGGGGGAVTAVTMVCGGGGLGDGDPLA